MALEPQVPGTTNMMQAGSATRVLYPVFDPQTGALVLGYVAVGVAMLCELEAITALLAQGLGSYAPDPNQLRATALANIIPPGSL